MSRSIRVAAGRLCFANDYRWCKLVGERFKKQNEDKKQPSGTEPNQ